MIDSSAAYKAAVVADSRRTHILASVNIVDPDIVYGTPTGSPQASYSQSNQLHDYNFNGTDRYATLEQNRWLLDGTFEPIGEVSGQVGYVTDALVDSGTQIITQNFSGVDVLQAVTLQFPTLIGDGVAFDFTVEILQGATIAQTFIYTDNREPRITITGFTITSPTAIRLTITAWSIPGRRARVIEIMPGIHEEWDEDNIPAISVTQQANFAMTALPYGTCTLTVDNSDRRFEPENKDGIFRSIEERQSIDVKIGVSLPTGVVEYKGVGNYFQYSGGWKTGNNGMTIQWDLVDIIGLISGRQYIPPTVLPTTLSEWVASIVGQLGANFYNYYIIDPAVASIVIAPDNRENITGKKCSDILCYICMAAGTWACADQTTGKLAVKPLPVIGGIATLDNMENYPTVRANDDIAALIFKLYDVEGTEYIVAGNEPTSNNTVSIDNPFIKTTAQANAAAAVILKSYGGNMYETVGRGDPSAELGDVDTVQIRKMATVTARRMAQTFAFSGGVMRGCQSVFVEVRE